MWTWILLMMAILPIPWVVQYVWPHRVTFAEIAIVTVISAVLTLLVYGAGKYAISADTEMLNGHVIRKERIHGKYDQPYQCNCRQVCSGTGSSRSCYSQCDTCYETHYTVNWVAITTIQQIAIDSSDRTTKRVYDEPDPPRYTTIRAGDPVTVPHWYTNYVKAAPDSLFHASASWVGMFKNKIPPYPNKVYDIYKLDRVLSVGVPIPDMQAWNDDVSKYNGQAGTVKQSNLIIVFVDTPDSNYIHALAGSWIGGKKNDIVVVVGSPSYPAIEWVRVLAWTDNEVFKVQLVHELEELATIDRPKFMEVVKRNVDGGYKRKPMADYQYLQYSVDPPWWIVALALLTGVVSALGISYYFYVEKIHNSVAYRRRKL